MRVTLVAPWTYVSSSPVFSMPVCRYPTTGLARTTVSASSSSITRSTPCVDGCWGPMLMIIVSPSPSTSGQGPPVRTSSRSLGCSSCAPSSVCWVRRGADRNGSAGAVSSAWSSASPFVTSRESLIEVRVAVEPDAEHVERLALAEVHPRVRLGEARHRCVSRRNLADGPNAAVAGMREEVRDHLESLRLHAWNRGPGRVHQVVDRGHVDALGELVLVPQEPGEIAPHGPVDVEDRLAVRKVEHGARETLNTR